MNSFIIATSIIKRMLHEVNAFGFLFLFPVLASILAVAMFANAVCIDIGVSRGLEYDKDLIRYLETIGKYQITEFDHEDMLNKIEEKSIKAGIVFPEEFIEALNNGEIKKIQLISYYGDSVAQELSGSIQAYYGAKLSGEEIQVNTEASLKEKNKLQAKIAIGMMSMFIFMFVGNGMMLLLEDKKIKTFMRIFCAPVKAYEMVMGYLLACGFLGFLQIVLFLLMTTTIFNIQWGTSVLNVFIIMVIYLIAALGMAIGMLGFIQNSQIYSILLSLIGIGTSFLGGAFLPLEYMSDFIQKLANFTPQKWFMEAYTKLAEGGNIIDIKLSLGILLLFGIVLFTFGIKTLRPNVQDL